MDTVRLEDAFVIVVRAGAPRPLLIDTFLTEEARQRAVEWAGSRPDLLGLLARTMSLAENSMEALDDLLDAAAPTDKVSAAP